LCATGKISNVSFMGWNIHSGKSEEGLEGRQPKTEAGAEYYAFAL
jgi:hypothetical protein